MDYQTWCETSADSNGSRRSSYQHAGYKRSQRYEADGTTLSADYFPCYLCLSQSMYAGVAAGLSGGAEGVSGDEAMRKELQRLWNM